MKKLIRHPDIHFKNSDDVIHVIDLKQHDYGYTEVGGVACWIVKDGLTEALTREELIEFAREDFEDLPEDFAKIINKTIEDLIQNRLIIEIDV